MTVRRTEVSRVPCILYHPRFTKWILGVSEIKALSSFWMCPSRLEWRMEKWLSSSEDKCRPMKEEKSIKKTSSPP